MVAGFRAFMAEKLGLTAAQQDEFAARLDTNLARQAEQLADGTCRVPFEFTVEPLPGNRNRLWLHSGSQSTIVYEGDLDACSTWAIGFLIQIGLTIYSVYSFHVNLDAVGAGVRNYLGGRLDRDLVPALRQAFAQGCSAQGVYNAMNVLWDFGLLTGMMKFLWQACTDSVSILTVVGLGMRLGLLFSPLAPLEVALFVVELVNSMVSLVNAWKDPNNCWKSA